jgi:hypothetical protein
VCRLQRSFGGNAGATGGYGYSAVGEAAIAMDRVLSLEKVLSSGVFKSADRLRDLLRFAVYETLEGRGDELKESRASPALARRRWSRRF